jgi:hypothetical protein
MDSSVKKHLQFEPQIVAHAAPANIYAAADVADAAAHAKPEPIGISDTGISKEEFERKREELFEFINKMGYNNQSKLYINVPIKYWDKQQKRWVDDPNGLEEVKGFWEDLYQLWKNGFFQVYSNEGDTPINMDDIIQIFKDIYNRYMNGRFGPLFRNQGRLHRRIDYIIDNFSKLNKQITALEFTDDEATYNKRKRQIFKDFANQVIREQKGGRKTCKKRYNKSCKKTYNKSCKKRYNKSCKKRYNKSCKKTYNKSCKKTYNKSCKKRYNK